MYCPSCGQEVNGDAQFCDRCGAPLHEERRSIFGSDRRERSAPVATTTTRGKARDPYKDQIAALRLQIKELKLEYKKITSAMSNTRAQYYQTSAFVPEGILHKGYKWFEDLRLLGPQQQKQRLQQEIMRLEQDLLRLQQAQYVWKQQQ